MKKIIAWLLLVTMLLGTFAGCSKNTEQTSTQPTAAAIGDVEGITAAIDYLKAFYKDGGTETFADFERYGIVRIAGVPYEVVWSVDVSEDLVKIVVNDDGTVTIDVNESCEESTPYVLTATISDEAGNSVNYSWNYILPVGMGSDYGAIVDMAYALEKDQALDFSVTLVGTVTAINTAWSEEYKNITVTISVEGREDKPIMCYRMKGDGAEDLAVGDLITVSGIIKNYNGTIEFDTGCSLDKVGKGAGNLGDMLTDPVDIVDAAYALEVGTSMPYSVTLTGTVSSIDTPYSPDYKNITVSIQVEGREDKPIMCYRMKGDGADTVMPGDVITVSGMIKNYYNTIEFDTGCQLVSVTKGENSMEILTDPDEILKAAFALDYGEYLPYPVTLSGTIIGTDGYSAQYGNITVAIRTGDAYFVKCYRMKGVDIDKIWLGDEITVTGNIMNYDGTIEFESGSVMVSWVDNPDPKVPSDPAEIVEAAYALSNYSSLPYYCTLTGEVTKIVKNWVADHYYVTVNMTVEGKTIQAYKLRGEGVEAIKVGDTITVWGMLKNYRGTIEFDDGCKLVSKKNEIVEGLYELESGESLEGEQTLTGKVTYVEPGTASCNAQIKVSGKTIECPAIVGSGTDKLEIGDTITVRGTLTNNNGSYSFGSGSALVSWSNANRPKVDASNTQAEVVEAAKQLGTADYMYGFILSGVVTSVDTPYDSQYGNVTVTMEAEGTKIQCYRLDGKGADVIGVGDTIRVSGNLINYNGAIQYAQYCTILNYTLAEKPEEVVMTPAEIVDAAYELGTGETLGTYTLSGEVVSIDEAWSGTYCNITVTMAVAGKADKPIQCYRMKGQYAPFLAVGDTITVNGTLVNYNGKVEFNSGCEVTASNCNPTQAEIVEVLYGLADGKSLSGTFTLTGVVTKVENLDTSYQNVEVTIMVAGKEVLCYRLKGDNYDKIAVGDTISVSGTLKNHYGTKEFTSGCVLVG